MFATPKNQERHPPFGPVANLSFFAALVFVAAVVHIGLALVALFARPRSAVHWLMTVFLTLFGCSALAFGLHLMAQDGAIGMSAERAAAVFSQTRLVLEWPGSLFVLVLALWISPWRPRTRAARAALVTTAATFAVLWAMVFLRPDWFYEKSVSFQSYVGHQYWHTIVIDELRYYVTMGIALVLLGREHIHGGTTTDDPSGLRDASLGAALLFLGLILGPLSSAPGMLYRTMGPELAMFPTYALRHQVKWTLSGLGAVPPLMIAAWAVWASRRAGRPWRMLAAWCGGTVLVGTVVVFPRLGEYYHSVSGDWFWELFNNFGTFAYLFGRPFFIGYAMFRHGFLEVPDRLRQGAMGGIMVATAGLLYFPTVDGIRDILPGDPSLATGLASVLGLAVVVAGYLLIVRHVGRPSTGTGSLEHERFFDEAIEVAMTNDGTMSPERATELERLAGELGIPADRRDTLLAEARLRRAAPASRLEKGMRIMDRYEVLGPTPGDGTGAHWRCHDTVLGRAVDLLAVEDEPLEAAGGRRVHDLIEALGSRFVVVDVQDP